MRTKSLFLIVSLLVVLSIAPVNAAPNAQTLPQIGIFTPIVDVIVRYAPGYFGFDTPQADGILPAGTVTPVYGTYYDDNTHQVWCYTTPTLHYFVPCGQTSVYYIPAYGALAMLPGHDNPLSVTRPG